MDKQALLEQLMTRLREQLRVSQRASKDAQQAARDVATAQEKVADARESIEYGALATGHAKRLNQLGEELAALERVRLPPATRRAPVGIGSIVEIEDEETQEGRTFFVLPVGAGQELTGPGGDGLLTVVTPQSPIGRAVVGRLQGDSIQVTTQGEPRDWNITFVE
jgi:transcription elongation GreA/GreB family factor